MSYRQINNLYLVSYHLENKNTNINAFVHHGVIDDVFVSYPESCYNPNSFILQEIKIKSKYIIKFIVVHAVKTN